jgi:hypothetical protein
MDKPVNIDEKECDIHKFSREMGKDMAFGVQQTIACLLTDFIDPYISKWYQNRFGSKEKEQEVTMKHTWAGELAGDFGGLGAYVGIKALFRSPIESLTQAVEEVSAPLLEKMGKSQMKRWAKQHHVQEGDAIYSQELEAYKQFQAKNIVDSSILALSSSAINVVAQRVSGNQQPYRVIIGSKVVGAGLTMATMLAARSALPDTSRTLDDELSERYFSKAVRKVQRFTGSEPPHHAQHDAQHPWAQRVQNISIAPKKKEMLSDERHLPSDTTVCL